MQQQQPPLQQQPSPQQQPRLACPPPQPQVAPLPLGMTVSPVEWLVNNVPPAESDSDSDSFPDLDMPDLITESDDRGRTWARPAAPGGKRAASRGVEPQGPRPRFDSGPNRGRRVSSDLQFRSARQIQKEKKFSHSQGLPSSGSQTRATDSWYGSRNKPGKTQNSKSGRGRDTARALENAQHDVEVRICWCSSE